MTDIETYLEHEVSELICLKCLNRWIGVYPIDTPLKDIECKCGEVGYVIKTGQIIEENECDLCIHSQNGRCKIGLHSDGRCGYRQT